MKCLPGTVCLLVIIYNLKALERELIQEFLNSEYICFKCDFMTCHFKYVANGGRHDLNDVIKWEASANYLKY